MFTVFRRFYKSGDAFIITEIVGVFTDRNLVEKILEDEIEDKRSLYFHLDTYFVETTPDQLYKNIAENTVIAKKIFHQ
jgi:hypothetical protein